MLWLKSLHVIFMVTWFAGLFYLPRLFVYFAESESGHTRQTLATMQRKLLVMTWIGGLLTVILGVAMLVTYPAYLSLPWMHVKLTLVMVLVIFHGWLHVHTRALNAGKTPYSSRFYRWINEVPTLVLIPVVILVILKPVFG